jgi:hypothetical protein
MNMIGLIAAILGAAILIGLGSKPAPVPVAARPKKR